MDESSDVLEGLKIKEPILIPGLGKLFWRPSYQSSGYDADCDFLDSSYVPKWLDHYSVPQVDNENEIEFQYFSLNLVLDEPLRSDSLSSANMHIDHLLETIGVSYNAGIVKNATLDQLSLPKNLVLALESILVNLNGKEMSCYYCNVEADDDPLLITIEFIRCQTSRIPPDDILLTIASVISAWMS